MKLKAKHLITGATVAIAAALLIATNPSMTITEATTERVVIETTGYCKYSLRLSHAPSDCNPLEGPRVLSATDFVKGTFYWDAIGLEFPEVGDEVCGQWACVDKSREFSAVVTGEYRIYLPLVMNGGV